MVLNYSTFQGIPTATKYSQSNKSPIVFIVGFGSRLSHYDDFIDVVGGKRDIHALELNGFNDGSRLIDDSLGVLYDYIKENGLEHAHLVGHSRGGAIVTKYGYDVPHDITQVTAINPSLSMSTAEKREFFSPKRPLGFAKSANPFDGNLIDKLTQFQRLAKASVKGMADIPLSKLTDLPAQALDAFGYDLNGKRDFTLHVIASNNDPIAPYSEGLVRKLFGENDLIISLGDSSNHFLPITKPKRTFDSLLEKEVDYA